MNIIAGVISYDGKTVIKSVGDFTLRPRKPTLPPPGRFIIDFPPNSFSKIPAVVVSHVWDIGDMNAEGGSNTDRAVVNGVSTKGVKIGTGHRFGNKDPYDFRSFSFIAIGEAQVKSAKKTAKKAKR